MSRKIHALLGLPLALLLTITALSGACLSLLPMRDRFAAARAPAELTAAQTAAAALASHPDLERLVRTPAGQILAYPPAEAGAIADILDPTSGRTLGAYLPGETARWITDLHRAFFLDMPGRATAALGAAGMLILTISGGALLARRAGGWRHLLRPIKAGARLRRHGMIGRAAMLGLGLSALSGLYMSGAAFGWIDNALREPAFPSTPESSVSLAPAQMAALRAIPLTALQELAFPSPDDPADLFRVTTDQGVGFISPANGELLAYRPHGTGLRIYRAIYALHTGAGLWPAGLIAGFCALAVPYLALTGLRIWLSRQRRRAERGRNSERTWPARDERLAAPHAP